MKEKKSAEVAVIDFEKFSIAQLPELNGKKEEIKSLIDANPAIEVVDNPSYELAKKSRTAVKTLRTGLEKEQKEVKKKIKEFVLDVVDKEYDTLILGVKNQEIIRQGPIDIWEAKKEEERLERVRLEQERVDNIKKSITEFANHWNTKISLLKFSELDAFETELGEAFLNFDRGDLAEYEVLFDDQKTSIYAFFENIAHSLTEKENIRLEQIKLAEEREKQRIEAEKLAEAQRIEREKFEAEQKLALENQRIAQEKFLKEKREFEEKQLEAKFQERKKFLVDEGYWSIYFTVECFERESTAKLNLLNYDEIGFENFKQSVLKAKEPAIEIVSEQTQEVEIEEMVALSFDPIPSNKEANTSDVEKELTWGDVFEEFLNSGRLRSAQAFVNWLSENYNCPTRKI